MFGVYSSIGWHQIGIFSSSGSQSHPTFSPYSSVFQNAQSVFQSLKIHHAFGGCFSFLRGRDCGELYPIWRHIPADPPIPQSRVMENPWKSQYAFWHVVKRQKNNHLNQRAYEICIRRCLLGIFFLANHRSLDDVPTAPRWSDRLVDFFLVIILRGPEKGGLGPDCRNDIENWMLNDAQCLIPDFTNWWLNPFVSCWTPKISLNSNKIGAYIS